MAVASVTATVLAGEFNQHAALEKELCGDWLAAETYVAQPPPALRQSISFISFQTNNIVEWKYIQGGKAYSACGRYGIYSFSTDKTKLPSLCIAPTNYPNAVVSSHLLLTLLEVELGSDSRFLQLRGKLLKAVGPEGKRVLFIRKETKISSQPAARGDGIPPPQP